MTQKTDRHDAGNRDSVERARLHKTYGKRQEVDDIQALMKDERFRRFMFGLLSDCRIFQTTFTGNSQTFFREGERNVGLRQMSKLMAADRDGYFQMLMEHQKPQESNDDRHAADRAD